MERIRSTQKMMFPGRECDEYWRRMAILMGCRFEVICPADARDNAPAQASRDWGDDSGLARLSAILIDDLFARRLHPRCKAIVLHPLFLVRLEPTGLAWCNALPVL
jgi:hypothetical protein